MLIILIILFGIGVYLGVNSKSKMVRRTDDDDDETFSYIIMDDLSHRWPH
jgi:hypothetical protein